jgi:hypothetical protein
MALLSMLLGTAAATLLSAGPGVIVTMINTSITGIAKIAVLLCVFACIDICLIPLFPIFPVLPCALCVECIILSYALLSAIGIQVISTTVNTIVYTIIGLVVGIAGSYLVSIFAGSLHPRSLSIIPIITVLSSVAGGVIGVPTGAVATTIINLPYVIISPLSGVLGIVLWPVSGAVIGALSGFGCGFVGAITSIV